jgi:hypothetical protein
VERTAPHGRRDIGVLGREVFDFMVPLIGGDVCPTIEASPGRLGLATAIPDFPQPVDSSCRGPRRPRHHGDQRCRAGRRHRREAIRSRWCARSDRSELSVGPVAHDILGVVGMAVGTLRMRTRRPADAIGGTEVEADLLVATGKQTRHRRAEPLHPQIPNSPRGVAQPQPAGRQYASSTHEERGTSWKCSMRVETHPRPSRRSK